MFMPIFSSSDLNSSLLCRDSTSNCPCSWHLGQTESTDTSSSDDRMVRQASSAGKSNMCPQNKNQYSPQRELQNDPKTGQNRMTPFRSSIELTMDDIDYFYVNTSYEDLKLMIA